MLAHVSTFKLFKWANDLPIVPSRINIPSRSTSERPQAVSKIVGSSPLGTATVFTMPDGECLQHFTAMFSLNTCAAAQDTSVFFHVVLESFETFMTTASLLLENAGRGGWEYVGMGPANICHLLNAEPTGKLRFDWWSRLCPSRFARTTTLDLEKSRTLPETIGDMMGYESE